MIINADHVNVKAFGIQFSDQISTQELLSSSKLMTKNWGILSIEEKIQLLGTITWIITWN